jgi:hypothetical protein
MALYQEVSTKRVLRFKYLAAIGLVVVATTSCLSSGIVSVGGGHYMLSKSRATIFSGSKAEMAAEVYSEAEAFCKEQGKSIRVIEDSSLGPMMGRPAEGNIRFVCE